MRFEVYKQQVLARLDKSRKGSVDEPIKSFLEKINLHPSMVTLSSCSGRAMLLTPGKKKFETQWHYVTHDVPGEALLRAYEQLHGSLPRLDFKYEGAILHVAVETLPLAWRFLRVAQEKGWKHSGILSVKKQHVVLELVIPLSLSTILGEDTIWMPRDVFSLIVREAAEKQRENWKRLEALERAFTKAFLP